MTRSPIACLGLTLSACLGTSISGATGASIGGAGTGSTGGSSASSTGGSTSGGSQECAPPCSASQLCVAGSCVDLCALVGQASCDGGCADLKTDNANCGTCGRACPFGEGCVDGGCQGESVSCQRGYQACIEPDGGFVCIDPSVDPENCGGCGVSCGTDVCRSGGCVCVDPLTACALDAGGAGSSGLTACLDLDKDPAACGSCGHACVSCETCTTGICTPKSPLTLSGYVLSSDAGDEMYAGAQLISGDINGDGISDLVELNFPNVGGAPMLGWSFGLLDGGFAAFQYLSTQSATGDDGSGNNQIVIADFNRDGFADVLLSYTNTNDQVGAYLFRGSASGLTPTSWIGGGSSPDVGTGVGDVNHDGWPDLVIGSNPANVLLNLTDGGFVQAAEIANPPYAYASARFAIADLNGDGRADVVAPGRPGSSRTEIAYQLSDGGFSAWVALAGDPSANFVTNYGATVVVSSGDQIGLVSATSDGGLCGSLSSAIFPSPGLFQSGAVDLNHDGQLDVVSLGTTSLVSFLRTPTGWDSSLLVLTDPASPNWLAVLADGRVAVSDPIAQRILIFDDGCGP